MREGLWMQRRAIRLVVMRQKFGFVGRYIDADRAIAFAAFAGEAEVERFFDGFVLPAVFDDFSFRHLPEQVGAAAGGVLFVARDAEAGTHDTAGVAAALADSNAAQGSGGQAAVIVGKSEMRLGLPGIIAGAKPEIFVEAIGLDQFARVHLPIGIPERLELAEGLHEFGAKHFGKKLAAGLAVSVFAGDRAAVAYHEVSGLFHKLAEFAHAFAGFEIVVHARMHAGVAEVPVERAVVVEGLHQPPQVAEVDAEFVWRDGGVFEAFPTNRFAGDVRSHSQTGFADIPNAPRLARVGEQAQVGRRSGAFERLHQIARLRFSFGDGVGAEFDHQPAAAFGQHREAIEVHAFAAARVDHDVVKTFEADRVVLHDLRHVVGADVNIGPSDDEQHTRRRTLDEAAGGFENRDASSLGADERARHVKAAFREQVVEVVSGNAARNVGKLAADLLAVAVGEGLEAGVDFGAASTFANEAVEVVRAGRADVHALATVGEDLKRLDVVVRLAGHDRVHAAGVVADHAPERAAVVGSGIGREGEVVLLGFGAKLIEDHARLDARDALCGIDFEDGRHVLRKVEHDGGVTTLSSERGASAACEQRSAVVAAQGNGGEHVFFVAGNYDADRDLPVIGAVGGIESAAPRVEADFSAKVAAESSLK